jgi:hypothetical protein
MRKEIGEVVETLYHENGNFRIVICRNSDGTYSLHWEMYVPKNENPDPEDEPPYGDFWVWMRHGVTFCDSLETTRREALGRLSAELPEFRP